MNKIKVFFIVPTLYGGGAERVMSIIPQIINKDRFDVTLIVIGFEKDNTYDVTGISVKYLNKTRVRYSIFLLIKILAKHRPKIVLSTLSDLNVMMGYISVLFPRIKFIGRFTIVLKEKKLNIIKKNEKFRIQYLQEKISSRLLKLGYDLLDIILCQSQDMYYNMQINKFKVPRHKLRIIHNPMSDNFKLKSKKTKKNELPKFITVARLVPIKGYERILKALSKFNYPFEYTIIGEGREKNSIFKTIKELGIKENIVHIPYTNEVSKYLAESDCYLMGSYAEGFPNCLIESCSVGIPVIAYNAPGGLNEIIDNGTNGFMVNSEKEFIEKLKDSVSIEWDPIEIRNSISQKFNKNKIGKDYENLFEEMLK